MFRPLLSVSTLALIVAASPVALPAAWAADLGGNCCADLEERVAELEATTARKGNRKVSLTIYGQVTEQVMFWDDGGERNAYVNENSIAKNIIGFQGSAKINSDWSAGFKLEYEAGASQSELVNQLASGDNAGVTSSVYNTRSLSLRHAYWSLGSATLGTVSVGQTSTATSGLVTIDLGGVGTVSSPDLAYVNGGFLLRNKGGNLTGTGLASDGVGIVQITWSDLINGARSPGYDFDLWDTSRRNIVRYQSPTLAGFIASASLGEDDFWDASLRYAGEFSGFRIAAGIGYREDRDFPIFSGACPFSSCERYQKSVLGGASIMHVPTGIFVSGSAGENEVFNPSLIGSNDNRKVDTRFHYISGGLSQNFFGLGKTVIYGEYSKHEDGLRLRFSDVTSSDVTMWGAGIVQNIDAAAMELYISYKNYEGGFQRNNGTLANPVIGNVEFRDFQTVMTGARIRF